MPVTTKIFMPTRERGLLNIFKYLFVFTSQTMIVSSMLVSIVVGCVRFEILNSHRKYGSGTPFVAGVRQLSDCWFVASINVSDALDFK